MGNIKLKLINFKFNDNLKVITFRGIRGGQKSSFYNYSFIILYVQMIIIRTKNCYKTRISFKLL
jgi:hypothetical protein